MVFRTWGWLPLLAGCGTLTYYEGKSPADTAEEGDDDDNNGDDDDDNGDDDDDTTGDDDDTPGDDDDTTTPGDDDDDTTTPGDDDDDTTTTTTDACVYPSVPVTAAAGAGNMPAPYYVGVSFVGNIVDDVIYDYSVDGLDYSSILIFTFYDLYITPMCDVVYDASGATPASGWTTDSGEPLWVAFDVPLSGGNSTCGSVNAGAYTDMRDWIEDQSWGFGLGEMSLLTADLSYAINYYGGSWAADWAPYTYSMYVTGGPFGSPGYAIEATWAQSVEHECAEALLDVSGYVTPLPIPAGAPLEDFVNTGPWMVYLIQ